MPEHSLLVSTSVCVCCVFLGIALVVQTLVNSRASIHFEIQIWGTVLSFGVATAFLTVFAIIEWAWWNSRKENVDKQKKLFVWLVRPKWYILLAGFIGVALITGGLLITYYVGSALFFVPLIVGQITCSAFVDHYGISLQGARKPFTPMKAFAILCVFFGAGLSVYSKLSSEIKGASNIGLIVGSIIASLVIGLILPFQAVLNREAALILSSRLQSVWWSFVEGTILALLIFLIQMLTSPDKANAFPARFADSQWYMYFGGCIGGVYVASALWFTGIIGFELYFVCLVSGQMAGSMIFDAEPLFGPSDKTNNPHILAQRICGIFLVVFGACIIRWSLPKEVVQVVTAPVKLARDLSRQLSKQLSKQLSINRYGTVATNGGDKGDVESPAELNSDDLDKREMSKPRSPAKTQQPSLDSFKEGNKVGADMVVENFEHEEEEEGL